MNPLSLRAPEMLSVGSRLTKLEAHTAIMSTFDKFALKNETREGILTARLPGNLGGVSAPPWVHHPPPLRQIRSQEKNCLLAQVHTGVRGLSSGSETSSSWGEKPGGSSGS